MTEQAQHQAGWDGPSAEVRRDALLSALGRRVRALRATRGFSQLVLAQHAGLSPRFLAQLEAGEGNISVANLAEVARALGVAPSRLLDEVAESASAGPDAPPPAIALVGLRGAGKSTLGPLLSKALRRRFVELDREVQELSGLATSEIFQLHGERYYRELERQALQRLIAEGESVVLEASGGAVADPELFRLLKERTLLVWVKADPEQHMQRVLSQGDQRPMADRPDAMAELRQLLRSRRPYYEQARLVADTSATTPKVCVGRLVAQLERMGA